MNVGMRSFYPIGVFGGWDPYPPARMRRLLTLPFALLVAGVASAAPAGAAEIHTDRTCYYQTPQTTVSLAGSGFSPGRPYSVALDGDPLGGGGQPVRPDGTLGGAFQPASLTGKHYEETHRLDVESDALSSSTTFTVTRLFATFSPASGDPAKLRVRFAVYGFGLDGSHPNVYVHYVAPGGGGGKARKSVRLGHVRGQCGSIHRTAQRRLFPFKLTRYGRWVLQFDARRSYTPGVAAGTNRSDFVFYSLGVCVRPPGSQPLRAGQKCPTYR